MTAPKARRRERPSELSLGALIAQERLRQGLTQNQLARAVDCPDAMIAHLEQDRRNYWVKLRAIIEFLAVRSDEVWVEECTTTLMKKIATLVRNEPDPIGRLILAERLRSSGDRAMDHPSVRK